MSCDANFSRFARQAGQAPAITAALGAGDAAHAAAALEEIAELARARAAQALRSRESQRTTAHQVADLQAMAHCSLLFERMRARDIKPPSHGRPKRGMPFAMPDDPAAMYAYAAVAETLAAIDSGQPLPPLAREVIAGVRARAAAAAPARLPLAPGQRYTREHILDARDGDAVHVRLTRLEDQGARVVYEGPAVLHVQRARVPPRGSRRAPRQSDPEQATLIALKDRGWAEYATGHDMDGNSVLVNEDYQMEIFAPRAGDGRQSCPDCGQFMASTGHVCRVEHVEARATAMLKQLVPAVPALRTTIADVVARGPAGLIWPETHAVLRSSAEALIASGMTDAVPAARAARAYLAAPQDAEARAFANALAPLTTWDADEDRRLILSTPRAVAEYALRTSPSLVDLANGDEHPDSYAARSLDEAAQLLAQQPDLPADLRALVDAYAMSARRGDWAETAPALAAALCDAAGVQRCPDCNQFMAAAGHVCPAQSEDATLWDPFQPADGDDQRVVERPTPAPARPAYPYDWDPYQDIPFTPPDPAPAHAPIDAQARAFVTGETLVLLSQGWPESRGPLDDRLHDNVTRTLDAAARHLQGRADLTDALRREIQQYLGSRAAEQNSDLVQSRDAARRTRWEFAGALAIAAGQTQCQTCGRLLDAGGEHDCVARFAHADARIATILARGEVNVSAIRRIARDLSDEPFLPPNLGDAADRASGWGGPADADSARFFAAALDETVNRPLSGTPREQARQALAAYDIRLIATEQLPIGMARSPLDTARQRFALLRAARALRSIATPRDQEYLDYALGALRSGEAFPDGGAQLARVIDRILRGTGPLND